MEKAFTDRVSAGDSLLGKVIEIESISGDEGGSLAVTMDIEGRGALKVSFDCNAEGYDLGAMQKVVQDIKDADGVLLVSILDEQDDMSCPRAGLTFA